MNDITTVHMFSVPLFKIKVAPWQDLKQKILSLVEHSSYQTDEKGFKTDFYNNNYNADVYKILKPFVASITTNCFGLYPPVHPPNMWSQKYYANTEHPVHNHGNRGYSFILFLKFDPSQHKSTNFISPFDHFFTGEMLFYEPEIEEGDLIAFPSTIKHSSQYQTSDQERMILAFNLFPDGA